MLVSDCSRPQTQTLFHWFVTHTAQPTLTQLAQLTWVAAQCVSPICMCTRQLCSTQLTEVNELYYNCVPPPCKQSHEVCRLGDRLSVFSLSLPLAISIASLQYTLQLCKNYSFSKMFSTVGKTANIGTYICYVHTWGVSLLLVRTSVMQLQSWKKRN